MKLRPQTLSDFRKIGKRKLAPRTAEEAKAIHDQRQKANKPPRVECVSISEEPKATLKLRKRIVRQTVLVPLGCAYTKYTTKAHEQYPRRKNWDAASPTKDKPVGGWKIYEHNHGRYSSRCRYTHWTYEVKIHSTAFVTRDFIVFWFADNPGKRIKAPKGYHWDKDSNGLKLVYTASPTRDFHPTASDLQDLTPHKMAKVVQSNWRKRRDALALKKRLEREAREKKEQEIAAVKRAEEEGATVCLADSLRAGNCRAGTESWASRHGLNTKQHYTPSQVLSLANGDLSRVALVVTVALRRHRLEMERGYAELADHRC
jgi:hypothetical protein